MNKIKIIIICNNMFPLTFENISNDLYEALKSINSTNKINIQTICRYITFEAGGAGGAGGRR